MKCGHCKYCTESSKSPSGYFCRFLFSKKYAVEPETECSVSGLDWFLQNNEE